MQLFFPDAILSVFENTGHQSLWYSLVYGVATMSRMLENTGLFAEYRSLL